MSIEAGKSSSVITRLGGLKGAEVNGVHAFLGVPYAEPPVGALRWRSPVPIAPWAQPRDATKFGGSAPQFSPLMTDIPAQDEDCLYLNIWTPRLQGAPLPVLVWIHGGSFTTGAGAQPMYDGNALAKRGAVVVTINYRIDNNRALHDQITALQWVRDHIDAFGGDPDNVTVFGESAGAMSIGALLASQAAAGLFHKAVLQSGAAHHTVSPSEGARMAEVFLRALGASSASPDALWNAPAAALVKAQLACGRELVHRGPSARTSPQGSMTLLPVSDGGLLPEAPFEAIVQSHNPKLPLMLGTNRDEWNFFIFLTEPGKRNLTMDALLRVLTKRVPGREAEVVAHYQRHAPRGDQLAPWQLYSMIESDRTFRVPAIRLAEAVSRRSASVFMYMFDWQSTLFNGEMGACHAVEIPFLFGTLESQFGKAFLGGAAGVERLSAITMDSWLAFARTGNPSHEGVGPWPTYNEKSRETQWLAAQCRVESAPWDALRAFWDDIL
jgi:para-nitrobenzyl esterase